MFPAGLDFDPCNSVIIITTLCQFSSTLFHGSMNIWVCISVNGDFLRIDVLLMLRKTGRYLSIIEHNQGDV